MSKSLFLAGLLSASAVMAADVQYFVGAGIEKGDVDVNASALGLTLSDNVKDTALKLKFGVLIDNEQITENNWQEYVFNWNEHLHDNIDIYLHDTYLRSLVGCNFEEILKSEFLANYPLLSYVDKDHVIKINEKHILVKAICDQLYDIKL